MNQIKKNKTVVILGTAHSINDVPWNVAEYDYWACAPTIGYPQAKGNRIDVLFEFHSMEVWMKREKEMVDYGVPVLMQKKVPSIPNSMTYPIKEIQKKFSTYTGVKYFTSTISYMIALAIYLGYEEIISYGVHMAATDEYGDQRQSCEYWSGVANGKGVIITYPPESTICRTAYLYGYEQESSMIAQLKKRKAGIEAGVTQLKTKMETLKKDIAQNEGAVKEMEWEIQRWG